MRSFVGMFEYGLYFYLDEAITRVIVDLIVVLTHTTHYKLNFYIEILKDLLMEVVFLYEKYVSNIHYFYRSLWLKSKN